uniref:Protein-PII uridylyltransferase N-terminal domain-containing protein n=1 Tax=Branchiostoma floridae TaxID=7739 RepID=C3YQW9_BRAFL|eukprot:XP_002601298.1 hypothetical protein BRAFLDRAFT_81338 [Branchiostoma floridae]
MASFAEKLQALESRLQTCDPETALAGTLIDAVATKDTEMTLEALKTLGDLYLENGMSTKVTEEFEKATRLYTAALLRCPEQDVADTIKHRIRYTEKMSGTISSYHDNNSKHRPESNVNALETYAVTKNVGRIADICLQLEASYKKDEGVIDPTKTESSYTKTLLRALANSDQLLEEAMMQDIGDLYLEEGRVRSELTMLNKASAMYEAAMKTCIQGTDRWETLQHRVNYSHKVKEAATNDKRKHSETTSTLLAKQTITDVLFGPDVSQLPGDPDTLSSYRRHVSEGDRALRHEELDTAEEEFASALKVVNDIESNQFRLKVEAECLQKLGHVYLERGKVTKAGGDFTKAAALFNAVMARTEDKYQRERIRTVLRDTERLFLYHTAGVDTVPSKYDIDLPHKRAINEMRETIFQQFQGMDKEGNPYRYANDHPKAREAELVRANAMQNLCKKITDDRNTLVEMLLAECMEKVGPPPCRHAFIGLGSQATELATPYSDLEFAILIEEGKDSDKNKQYFRTLTHYLHLKVINLGETVVPAMAITSLNDFCSEDPSCDWFYDRNTPRGFAFDGSMPWASKTPLGREQTKTKPPLELIQTPSGMASLQNTDLSLSDDYNLSWVLQHVCYMAGDRALVDDYVVMVTKQQCHSETKNVMSVTENIRNVKKPELTAQLLNVKKEVYRLPTLSIQNIASFFGVKSGSIWDMIAELRTKGHISMDNAHHLKVLVAISAELRLRAYLTADSQRESVSTLSQIVPESGSAITSNSTIESVLYLPNRAILYRYYYTAYPLRKLVLMADKKQTCLQGENILFDSSPYVNGMMHMNVCDFKAAQEEFTKALCNVDESDPIERMKVVEALADVSKYLGDPDKSVKYCQQGLNIMEGIPGANAKHKNFGIFLTSLGLAYVEQGKLEEAIKCYEKAMETLDVSNDDDDENKAVLYHNLGIAWERLGHYKKAIGFYEHAHEINVILYGQSAANSGVALTLNNLGGCWAELGDDNKAIEFCEKALNMYKGAYGYDAAHPEIAMTLANLGGSYLRLEDYKNAIDFFEHSLKMSKRIYGKDTPHPVTAGILCSLGSCWRATGQHKKTFLFLEKALRMNKTLYGHNAAHPDIATILVNIGTTWRMEGDQMKAMGFIKAALKMYQTLYGKDAEHPDMANVLKSLGDFLDRLGDHKEAVTIFRKSLKMMRFLYGEDAAHPDIAMTLNSLGSSFSSMGDYAASVAVYKQAVDMYRIIYGKDPKPDMSRALLNFGKALCDLGNNSGAIGVFDEALEILHRTYGQQAVNGDIAQILSSLGVAWNAVGDYRKAVGFFEKTLNMNVTLHVQDATHPDIVMSLNNLGSTHDSLGENHKAIAFYEQALDMSKRIHGPDADHEDIAWSLSNIGHSYGDLYDEKAIRFYEQALEMRQRMHGRESAHPDIAESLHNLGLTWKDFGDEEKAVYYIEQALAINRRMYENNLPCPYIVSILNTLGVLLSSLGDKTRAIDLFQESLAIGKHMYGDGTAHLDVVEALDSLGNTWKDLGDYKQAVDYYDLGLNMKKRLYGHDGADLHIVSSLNNLGICWSSLRDHHKALTFFKEALDMTRRVYGEGAVHPLIALCLRNVSKC